MPRSNSTGLSSRERVQIALSHREPDRVPTALWGGSYGLVDDVYQAMLAYLKLNSVAPFRRGHNISYMDDRLLGILGTDLRYAWPGASPTSPVRPGLEADSFLDSFGQTWKRAAPYYYAGRGILTDAKDISDIDRLVTWPDCNSPIWMNGVAERARFLRQQTETFVVMRMVASHGPFQTACDLRSTDQFLMDMALNPEFAQTLLDRVTNTLVGLLKNAMESGGEYFDMIELPGDDYASNTNLLFSPAMFRKFIKPAIRRMVAVIKECSPDIKVMLHSDGMITALLDDFVEVGVDVVHPLEPLPGMNMSEIKTHWGNQLAFLGGIDISHAMPGSRDAVIEEAKLRISQLAPGGGYILAPANHIQADVCADNVFTLYETAQHFGRYPIRATDA